jgi:nicotinamide mononucleotide (NMN) deamidase PncC
MDKYNKIADIIGFVLQKNSLTIAFAEDATYGCLHEIFSQLPDANQFYHGGITVQKISLRKGLSQSEAKQSEFISIQMAKQISEVLSSSVGVSVSEDINELSIGGSNNHFAYLSVAIDGKIVLTKKLRSRKKKIIDIQRTYCEQALKLILGGLKRA